MNYDEPKFQPQTQARFWIYLDGPVLLKLDPGKVMEHHEGGQTDEGWSWTTRVWTHEGDRVRCEWQTRAMDCDGRIDRCGAEYAMLSELRTGSHLGGVTFPAWRLGKRGQRDYSAEAAGY